MGGASSLFADVIVNFINSKITPLQELHDKLLTEQNNLRSRAHLSALALETTNALLSPLSSHLRRSEK